MRSRTCRNLVPVLFAIFVTCLAWQSYGQNVEDLTGKTVDPFRDASGKVVVLVFLRTDCPISNRYAPTIQELSARYSRQAAFWLVYPDKKISAAVIRKYLQDYGYKLPALRDPQRVLVAQGRVQVTPEVAVFDTRGRLAYHGRIDNWYEDFGRSRSAPTTHDLDDAIRATLSGKPPAAAVTDAVGCYISDLQ
ncbi:MAG: redoxin domain-containing protein [Acidobacteriia bacterium]|nr:redoxin domain-containing protein [Terriglobia bacterium]